MTLITAKLQTCGAEMETLLNSAHGYMLFVTVVKSGLTKMISCFVKNQFRHKLLF